MDGAINEAQLYGGHPDASNRALAGIRRISLGPENHAVVRKLIADQLAGAEYWVLVGGPPCQAYSVAGRSRMKHMPGFNSDARHLLYHEYLKILADHRPPVFVMENVRGLLSAKLEGQSMIVRIMNDLMNPHKALQGYEGESHLGYRLHGLSSGENQMFSDVPAADQFLVKAEKHGVPQARHRVFILGIRNDLQVEPGKLAYEESPTVADTIGNLPKIRSGLTGAPDTHSTWCGAVSSLDDMEIADDRKWLQVRDQLKKEATERGSLKERTASAYERVGSFQYRSLSFVMSDDRLRSLTGHESRAHMASDLRRYAFAAGFAKMTGRSPKLRDLPDELLPAHSNVTKGREADQFTDRFRVQIADRVATTVTAHISKDGHYYIHYDPVQCRSLTVREAARLQTFPDNYKFEGSRTEQYRQIGNAVPPYLAARIGEVVADVMDRIARQN